CHSRLVLDHEHAHAPSFAPRDERRMNLSWRVHPAAVASTALKKTTTAFLVAGLLLAGFGHSSGSSRFVSRVDNPWFPLKPGTTWTYKGVKDGRPSRDVVRATTTTKTIQGAPCRAVSDLLYVQGHLGERTTDWYA